MTGLSHWGRLMNWKGPVLPVVGGAGHAECGGASHGVLIGEDGALLPSGGPVGHLVWSLGLLGSRRHDAGVDPRALAHRRIERDSEQSSIQVRTLISVRIDYANPVVAAWYISRILRQFLLLPD